MRIKAVLLCLALAGCSTGIPVKKYNDHPASPSAFMLCHGYSCTQKSKAGFTDAEWGRISGIFKSTPAKTAEAERSKIAKAMALMEQYSGAKTGTDDDDKEAVGIKRNNKQLDCIDETVNTTMYVGFLQDAKLIKFHEITEPTHRGYLIDGTWPHNTAVIKEIDGGKLWALDSFYRKNGEEPYIVPRAEWLAGWRPPGATQ